MKLRTSPFVDRGTVLVVADTEHPETRLVMRELPASIVYCHPADERACRDAFALAGEHVDLSEALAKLRGAGFDAVDRPMPRLGYTGL